MLQRSYISNKCCSFELSIQQRILKKSVSELLTVLILKIIINDYWAANHHIRMISEGSCDNADWSNDAEYSGLHYRKKNTFKNILQYTAKHLF